MLDCRSNMRPEELNDLLSILAATPARIQTLLENISDEQLRQRHAAGEFSGVEHVCHLRDIETEGYTERINRILTEDRPFLADIDGGQLAIDRDYNKQDVHQALTVFAQARTENTRCLADLGPNELSREGTLEGVGTVDLAALLVMMRDHDAGHLEGIERVLRGDHL